MIDRDLIFRNVPPGPAFRRLSHDARGAVALATTAAVIDALVAEGREPDAWEGSKLLDALQALNRERWSDALGACAEALCLPDERGGGRWARKDDTASLFQLRRALAHTAAALQAGDATG